MKNLLLISLLITGLFFSCQKNTYDDKEADLKSVEQETLGDEACFEFVYPVTFIMPDGTTVTGNNKEELGRGIKAWYVAHPDEKDKPVLQYPVDVNFKGKIITINNDMEMKRVKAACEEENKLCFVLVYPITYILPDGTAITMQSEDDDEGKRAIKAWYVENPGVEEKPALQYPVIIKYREGKTIRISSKEEMARAKKGCD